ncbi:hypothetical protein B0H11DRAFT_1934509 [Mycena galericulata]|nr:hypothetical protein B0H11DRAFT_1934509 [Mycena galericulata]
MTTSRAIDESSQISLAASRSGEKRTRDEDSEEDDAPLAVSGNVNQNLTAAIKRYATKKRLRSDQIAEDEAFVAVSLWLIRSTSSVVLLNLYKDPPVLREAKSYANNLHLENLIAKIVLAKPPYAVSQDLSVGHIIFSPTPVDIIQTNIYSYGAAILLSVKLMAYKGSTPKNILFTILKKYRFDLSDGIEHKPADLEKIGTSFKGDADAKEIAPKDERQNIFDLTQTMVRNTQCEVNVLLYARVALMRKVYLKEPGTGYWTWGFFLVPTKGPGLEIDIFKILMGRKDLRAVQTITRR